jgi:hypothetical protein
MKVYIGKPRSWFGPYQLASALTFWVKKVPDEIGMLREPDWVHDKLGEFLAHGWHYNKPAGDNMFKDDRPKSWLYKALEKLHARTYIKIDDYDVWSLLPMAASFAVAQNSLNRLKNISDLKNERTNPTTQLSTKQLIM